MIDITKEKSENNKRLAKNTMVLYMRTIFILLVSLYTSRVVLDVLGIEDYGIYNVIGGFVSMFAVVSQTMIASTQRYLTFELGKKEDNHSQEVYSTSLVIHILLALILFFLFETFGLWFLNSELNIDRSRIEAANWIYQFSIVTFILQIIRSPFEATIIAHEKMSLFAYLNILEVILKLVILYLISYCSIDSLIQYGLYMMLIGLLVFCVYVMYCKRHFHEISFVLVRDKSYYKNIFSFAGYNFLGSVSAILANQGMDVLLNLFFGVTVNAAKGVANQVNAAVSKFVNDFTIALNPQITKSYAKGDINYTMDLVYKGSKFSFYLFIVLGLPICIETPYILSIWLKQVPEFTVIFIRWIMATALLNTFANSLSTCAMATGDIKKLSIFLGVIRLLVLPVAYICFICGLSAAYAFSVTFISTLVLVFVRISIVCKQLNVSSWIFIKEVILRCLMIGLLAFAMCITLHVFMFSNITFMRLILEFILMTISTVFIILTIGLSVSERNYILKFIKNKIKI